MPIEILSVPVPERQVTRVSDSTEMDIDELRDFDANRANALASSSRALTIDPALAAASSNARPRPQRLDDEYWDTQEGYDDPADEASSDETDAEDEFLYASHSSTKRTRSNRTGGILHPDGTVTSSPVLDRKGKSKALDQDVMQPAEEDLGRFIDAIRTSASTGVGGNTALDREFDRSIADELDAFDPEMMDDLTVGIRGRKRRKGQRVGRRALADLEPSPEVQRMLFTANEHYAQGRLEDAVELLSEIIRIDPIIRVTWYTLATIYEEEGDRERAIQCKIVATHLMGSKQAAGDWAELGTESRDLGLLHQAIYCFTQAVKANKGDVNSMWDRAYLLKMSGATKMAIKAFQALLELLPHDPGVLRELAPLLASEHLYPQAVQLLLAALSYYRQTVPEITPATCHLLNSYGYEDLETLADFLIAQRQYSECVRVLKQGVRWMQGRELETEWDTVSDDREFDPERKSRAGWDKGNQWLEREPVYELDIRLRARLGIARLGMSNSTNPHEAEESIDEAKRHFDLMLDEDVREFPELFDAVADAYMQREMHDRALDMLMVLAECEETNGASVWFKIGQCHAATGDFEDAKECFENVIEEEPANIAAKVALARILEQVGDAQEALSLIKSVMKLRRAREEEPTSEDEDPRKRRSQKSAQERESAHRDSLVREEERNLEASAAFSRLEALEPQVERGDQQAILQWLEIATRLIDSFRSTRQLFPSDFKKKFTGIVRRVGGIRKKGIDKQADLEDEADEMANRLKRSMIEDDEDEVEETSFRGRDFDQWVNFILQYCFILTQSDELELAIEVLVHVREASVFRQDQAKEESLRLGLIACYYHAARYDQVVAELRWWQNTYPYQSEPIRLMFALLSQGHAVTVALNEHKLQKFLIRQIKSIGQHADGTSGKEQSLASGVNPRSSRVSTSPVATRQPRNSGATPAAGDDEVDDGDEAGEDEEGGEGTTTRTSSWKPTAHSPVFLAAYGFMLINSQSYQPAIIYLLRAYSLEPEQPLLNLALGICYLHRAMTRQTDNRQHQIAQALAFMSQYRKLRGDAHRQEIEYNFARVFHHLGLQPHAAKHYRLALESEPSKSHSMKLDSDLRDLGELTKVTAYNLVVLLAASGQTEEAREVSLKYLAV
ncbi:transcription factor TFIIIC subunit TFC4 [Sporobolomyces koalae]|uniref:transcription factor TFIIIC subunit TFC4 n=1 Tax=Sporobolomyces koalae TaxID=500713 RepID=UPI00317C67F9